MLSRGWIENTDEDSPFFHFKFTLTTRDIDKKGTSESAQFPLVIRLNVCAFL